MVKEYTRQFAQAGRRWSCTFLVTLTGTEMDWTPECPPQSAAIWRAYRRWRDRCVDDFAKRIGVRHDIILDVPWARLRLRSVQQPVQPGAAYAWAAAHHAELRSTAASGSPEVRRQLLDYFGALMLATAPTGEVH